MTTPIIFFLFVSYCSIGKPAEDESARLACLIKSSQDAQLV